MANEFVVKNDTILKTGTLIIGDLAGTGYIFPSVAGAAGQSLTSDGAGNLSFVPTIGNVAADTTPQLGGDLDVNGNSIISVSDGDIPISPDGTGNVILDGLIWPATDGISGQILTTDGSGNLAFTTVAIGGSTFLDSLFRIQDDGDNSKQIAFQASAITTSSTRTITVPDQNIDLTPDTGDFIKNIIADTTPQLGSDLDVNGNSIISVSDGDIFITPDGSGSIVLDGLIWPSTDGSNGDVLTTDGSGNLAFQTSSGLINIVVDITARDALNPSIVAGEQAFVRDKGDGEWGLFMWDGGSWITIGTEESATVDSRTRCITITFVSGVTNFIAEVNDGAGIQSVSVEVTTVFDGTGPIPVLEIGDVGDPDRLMTAAQIDLTVADTYVVFPNFKYITGSDVDVNATFTAGGGGPVMGEAIVTITYS